MTRKPIIAGNWKMHMTHIDALALVRKLSYELHQEDYEKAEVVICPPFTALRTIQLVVEEEHIPIGLGAQNMHWEDSGAFTGEISGEFLKALHCRYVIIGHSERRQFFGETDETVNKRVHAVLRHSMTPIICVGETAGEKDSGQTNEVVTRQITAALAEVPGDKVGSLVVAYEPVWAIGTGRTPTPEEASETCGVIRDAIRAVHGEAADAVRIQYGGSVKPGNIGQFMATEHIDGALVGGAALEANSFAMIVRF